MATSFADAGPLDDYFRDETESFNQDQYPTQGRNLDTEMDMDKDTRRSSGISGESGDVTLVDHSPTTQKGWTGSLPNSAGPSSTVPGKFPSPSRLSFSDESFAERFRYLICSSGLLEKDYVPALSGGVESELGDSPDQKGNAQWKIPEEWIWKGKERWDLVLAAVALLVGLVISLGLWTILGLASVGVMGIGWYNGLIATAEKSDNAPSPSEDDTPQSLALTSLTNFITQSQSLNNTLLSSLTLLEPHPYNLYTHNSLRVTLHRFTGDMTDHLATATSTLLELTDRRELAVLGEMYDIPVVGSFFYSRRHHNSITDSSSDEDYDKPQRPVLPHRSSSHPSPQKHASRQSTSSLPAYASSSPLKKLHSAQRLSFSSSPGSDDRFTHLPDKTPRLSKRASVERLRDTWSQSPRFERPRHERRITEADEEDEREHEETTTSDPDQSTSSDDSTPVKSQIRRSSDNEDNTSNTVVSPKSPAGRAGLGVTIPRTPILTRETPRGSSSSPGFRHIPSPLSRRLSNASERLQPLRTAPMATPSRSLPGSTTLLPSPFMNDSASLIPPSSAPLRAAMSLDPVLSTSSANPKRRSLQNMVYYHSSDENEPLLIDGSLPAGVGLTRTRSMPLSDLQALRSASTAGGGGSRRSSLNPTSGNRLSVGLGIGLPPSFPTDKRSSLNTLPPPSPNPSMGSMNLRRVESISPLTTPSLKASCLGIHLKRRRLACCLLGLKFKQNQNEGYWRDIKVILDDLVEGMIEEKNTLERVLRDTEKEDKIMRSLDSHVTQTRANQSEGGIWSASAITSVFPFNRDFAPRTPDEVLLAEHVDKLAQAIIGCWKELSLVAKGEVGMQAWMEVRGRLGEGVREWERGREVISRMKSGDITQHLQEDVERDRDQAQSTLDQPRDGSGEEELSTEDLPEFMQSWICPENENPPDHTQENILPPVGRDMIFEGSSDLPISEEKVYLSKLSREERIKLTIQARAQGVSVLDLIRSSSGGEAGDRREGMREMRERGGMVVDELRGVIGSIRRMKGGEVEGEGSTQEKQPNGTQRIDMSRTPLPLGDRQFNENINIGTAHVAEDEQRGNTKGKGKTPTSSYQDHTTRNGSKKENDNERSQHVQIRKATNDENGNENGDNGFMLDLDLGELKRSIPVRPMGSHNDYDEGHVLE
ncbi:hypothetical protein I302_108056 [Kwoniella bestiolae CBS 10118]|uniref:Uncharacterized protein n=1 Tax=Kwoniella bestiolae CBS 10118 TaxID=1296100 RepID=A0A1B9FWS6_9TREE|nr:hypothetical protein I302_07578 [Kwoniella bestiolae CBS 10118]OCF23224.1 hypothetical protein I302_07578 [Kwoniella bestiolae CBS 10118]